MKKMVYAVLGIITVLIVSGCTQKVNTNTCQAPYISNGTACCLDQNNDAKCDDAQGSGCTNECARDTCEGSTLIQCSLKFNGCRYKVNVGQVKANCGVVCIFDTDCSAGDACINNSCVPKKNNMEKLEDAANRWARAYERSESSLDTLYDMLIPYGKTMKTTEEFIALYPKVNGLIVSSVRLNKVLIDENNENVGWAYYDMVSYGYNGALPAIQFDMVDGVWYANVFPDLVLSGCLETSDCYKNPATTVLKTACIRTCKAKGLPPIHTESGKEFSCRADYMCDCHCYNQTTRIGSMVSPDWNIAE